MLFKSEEKKFLKDSVKMIQNDIAKMGVIIRYPEKLNDTILKICNTYYKIMKEEEI